MKKILFSILIAGMSISFAACGNSKAKEKSTETETLFDLYGQIEKYTECNDIEGKTVDELIKSGYKYMGYTSVQDRQYVSYFTYEGNNYDVILDDSAMEIMENLDSGTTIGKISLMIRDCVVEKCYLEPEETDTTESADSYTEFVGKTIGELAEDGCLISGYVAFDGDYKFFLRDADGNKYEVTLDDSFSDKKEELEEQDLTKEERQELLKDCRIKTCLKK